MPKTTACMWHDDRGDEAAEFYVKLFPNSRIISNEGVVIEFELDGQAYQIIKGGPVHFGFSEAISISIACDGQEEADYYWDNLVADGGEEGHCGWLKDKFGLSWQVVPKQLFDWIGNPDPEKAKKAVDCMMGQKRLVLAELEAAANA